MSILGFGMGPFSVGLVSDILAPSLGVETLRYAMLLPICFLPVMVIALYAAAKALPNDLRTVGTQVEDDITAVAPVQTAEWNDGRGDVPVSVAVLRAPGEQ